MKKLVGILMMLFVVQVSFGQKTKKTTDTNKEAEEAEEVLDTLDTQTVIIEVNYKPRVSDAFKLIKSPEIEGDDIKKEEIDYSIKSFPVASTFTPATGKAKELKKEKIERFYKSYVSAGFGNYITPLAEVYLNSSSSRYNDFGIFLNHHSSQGGIKDVKVDDQFYDTKMKVYYKEFSRDMNWEINGGFQLQTYNWYGLPENVTFAPEIISAIDPTHTYTNGSIGGNIDMEDSFFKKASLKIDYFGDSYNTSEIHVVGKPTFEFPVAEELITSKFHLEYLNNSFEKGYVTDEEFKNQWANFGFSPSLEIFRDELTVNLGAKVYYTFDLKNSVSKFYAYPNVTASYKLISDVMVLFAGATGDLEQQTYQDFVEDNKFLAPSLLTIPEDTKYRFYLGTKGKLPSNISYFLKGEYKNAKHSPLFIYNSLLQDNVTTETENYKYGNSFSVIYDEIKTLSFHAGIEVPYKDFLKVKADVKYYNYDTTDQKEAWNLPNLEGSLGAEYRSEHWFAGAKLFFVGTRKDQEFNFTKNELETVELDSYLDLNLKGGYIFNNRLTAFVNLNNVLNQDYQSYFNYRVQGFQVLGGVTYKFDLNGIF
ncbi:TonB-dependent receptor [Aureivirga sp. CE67]|uniref:TonB-dependent receptor n=1 Tax=Aureivirga sp. CE67 TaxID=1788983 RepID=UPI0018C954C3|nr:TonB-dependent receptor [Aureivirga sp. CE67]